MFRIVIIFLVLLLSMFSFCLSDDYIYTNEDLKKYYSDPAPVQKIFVFPESRIKHSFSLKPEKKKVFVQDSGKVLLRVNESSVVKLHISGCPTLQNALDHSGGNEGYGDVEVLRRGRTLKELCDSVGSGCSVCFQIN